MAPGDGDDRGWGLSGKTAIITGASRGIGLAIARLLVTHGVHVTITGRNKDTLASAASDLGDPSHARALAGHADDPAHQEAVVARTIGEFGRLDLLVCNAGVNPVYGPLADMDLQAARKIVDVNCLAALGWIQHAHGQYMGSAGGAIVNVASIAGLNPAPRIGLYGASKAMLLHLTKDLAVELGPGTRVNAVAPAIVKTKFAEALYQGREEQISAHYPLQRLGSPEDVAGAVVFLLSERASWITGQTLVVDGGVSLTTGLT